MKCNTCNEEIPINWTITLKRITIPNGQEELKAYHMICSPKDTVKQTWLQRVFNNLTIFEEEI